MNPDHVTNCLLTDLFGRDLIDQQISENYHVELDHDLIEQPWPEVNPPSRRKDSELARMLDILDNLPRGKDAE